MREAGTEYNYLDIFRIDSALYYQLKQLEHSVPR